MSSSDKELLTLAAKAAGVGYADKDGKFIPFVPETWNPLTDDGDALRLAVKLRIELEFYDGFEEVFATIVTGKQIGRASCRERVCLYV